MVFLHFNIIINDLNTASTVVISEFLFNGIPNNLFYFIPRFPSSLSSPVYTAAVPFISQNEAMIICKNISENQINIVQGQMRAALCTHGKKGQLLTN